MTPFDDDVVMALGDGHVFPWVPRAAARDMHSNDFTITFGFATNLIMAAGLTRTTATATRNTVVWYCNCDGISVNPKYCIAFSNQW